MTHCNKKYRHPLLCANELIPHNHKTRRILAVDALCGRFGFISVIEVGCFCRTIHSECVVDILDFFFNGCVRDSCMIGQAGVNHLYNLVFCREV